MSWNSKVVWAEGMLLQQQHFQQHDRYVQSQLDARLAPFLHWAYGFSALELDAQQLALGKISLLSCNAILPDGTPVDCPQSDDLPLPLDVPEDARNALVVLALPLRRLGATEVSNSTAPDNPTRWKSADYEVADSNGLEGTSLLQIGKLRLRLALEYDVRHAHTGLGIARVIERRSDNQLVLDTDYCPPCLDCRAVAKIGAIIDEQVGLLGQRGELLAARLAQPGTGGVAEITDFMLLQLINRFEPLLRHYAVSRPLHPHALYLTLLQLAGELAVFTRADKRPNPAPVYRQDALRESFAPLLQDLRQALSIVLEANSRRLGLEERKPGLWHALVADTDLINSAQFVLAVNAQMPAEALRSAVPRQTKIGTIEKLSDIVNLQLSGIPLTPLPVAPRQLPFHAGYVYFELDRTSEYWAHLQKSTGFGIQVAGEFPGLQMEFWAISGK